MMLNNIFNAIPKHLPEELFETLLEQSGITVERIISKGHHTPEHEWYDQDLDEWVMLLQGQAELAFEDQPSLSLQPGDYLLIPAHTRHRVVKTAKDIESIWLAIHIRK